MSSQELYSKIIFELLLSNGKILYYQDVPHIVYTIQLSNQRSRIRFPVIPTNLGLNG